MVAVLFKAGDQVPVIVLVDVVGKADKVVPEQIGPTDEKLGVTFGLIVIVTELETAHKPVVGVKVYVVVPNIDVSTDEGLQVPVILLLEVVGKTGALAPWHKLLGIPVNVGVTFEFTVTFKVCLLAQGKLVGSGVNT